MKIETKKALSMADYDSYRGYDWKEDFEEIMKGVDLEVKPFGLEVKILRDGSDCNYFKIIKRNSKK